MASMLKAVGVLSCGLLLCPGRSDVMQASTGHSAEGEMTANQFERYGG